MVKEKVRFNEPQFSFEEVDLLTKIVKKISSEERKTLQKLNLIEANLANKRPQNKYTLEMELNDTNEMLQEIMSSLSLDSNYHSGITHYQFKTTGELAKQD